ncbi:hypothetical protein [Aquiflexum sp.]|uniref:hypothetical protein n=1 Tax=Aquiflexum sp. TaxID=1872584 RepID=UPI003593F19F
MDFPLNKIAKISFSKALANFLKIGFGVFWLMIVMIILFYSPINLNAQDTSFEYFSDQKYSGYPIITFKENFFNQPVYLIDGVKSRPKEVRAFMEIMPGDANEFGNNNTKLAVGSALRYAALAVITGTGVFLFTNELTPQNIRPWLFTNASGVTLTTIGSSMVTNAKRKNSKLIENYNYLVARENITGPYLRMDVRLNFIGEKIDIYDGPNLLDKARIRTLMEEKPEMYADYKKALNKQKVVLGLDLTGLVVSLLTLTYIVSPRSQPSTQNSLLIPFVFTGLGLGIASNQFKRSARNLTRHALDRYNFGNRYVPVVRQPSMEFSGPSFTLFSRSF